MARGFKWASSTKEPEAPQILSNRPEVQTLDVVYKCGHAGQRREIVYPHVGISHTLRWIKGNVKCKECYAMAKNDEWCELCNDKIKQQIVRVGVRELHVCGHCASLSVEGAENG